MLHECTHIIKTLNYKLI